MMSHKSEAQTQLLPDDVTECPLNKEQLAGVPSHDHCNTLEIIGFSET